VRAAGLIIVGWSIRSLDGLRRQTPQSVVQRVGGRLTDGDIVLLHDASEHDDFEPASVRALPELLRLLDDRDWTSVGLDLLLADGDLSRVLFQRGSDSMPKTKEAT
jgi:hypothetical protein